jgi:hypothetical protein
MAAHTEPSAAIELLMAERAIHRGLTAYARGIDRLDLETVRGCYWPEATDDHGSFKGGREDFIEFLRVVLARFHSTNHFLGNVAIDVDLGSGTARAETYAVAYHRMDDAEGNLVDMTAGLRYVDRWERRGDDWRIIERVVAYDWRRSDPAVGESGFASTYVRGLRSSDDIVYTIGT